MPKSLRNERIALHLPKIGLFSVTRCQSGGWNWKKLEQENFRKRIQTVSANAAASHKHKHETLELWKLMFENNPDQYVSQR
jgi:hypothetical protein